MVAHVLRHLPSYLRPMHHRVAPVQASPDASVVNLARERVEIVVGPFCLNQLRNRRTAGGERPSDLAGTEEARDGIGNRCRRIRVSGKVFG
jgi:hypothetical protein